MASQSVVFLLKTSGGVWGGGKSGEAEKGAFLGRV
jgi:hypothetical protein